MRIIVSQNPVTGMQVVRLQVVDPVTKAGVDVTFDTEQMITLDVVDGAKVALYDHGNPASRKLMDDRSGQTWVTTPSARIKVDPDTVPLDLTQFTTRYVEQVRDAAIEVYNRCGGHKLAARMKATMERTTEELN